MSKRGRVLSADAPPAPQWPPHGHDAAAHAAGADRRSAGAALAGAGRRAAAVAHAAGHAGAGVQHPHAGSTAATATTATSPHSTRRRPFPSASASTKAAAPTPPPSPQKTRRSGASSGRANVHRCDRQRRTGQPLGRYGRADGRSGSTNASASANARRLGNAISN